MSPYNYNPSNTYPARVFYVNTSGNLNNDNVNDTLGVHQYPFITHDIKLRFNTVELGYKMFP